MVYKVTFVRDGNLVQHVGLSRATAQALADYLAQTFRIAAEISLDRR